MADVEYRNIPETENRANGALFNGRATDMGQALELLIRAYSHELEETNKDVIREGGLHTMTDERRRELDDDRLAWETWRDIAQRCLQQYQAHTRALAEQWLRDEDDLVVQFGEALQSGDYTGLAF